jgi:hypothetical protein
MVTILLCVIMLDHPRLYIPPETNFIRFLVKDFPLNTALSGPGRG